MNDLKKYKDLYGLIGYPLSHSFSKKYFSEKFTRENIAYSYYELFPIQSIDELPALIVRHPNLRGLNVTIPYKQQVLPFMDQLDEGAAAVGAVNTIKVANGRLLGFNSDVYGFEQSLLKAIQKLGYQPDSALILGTGGAARAAAFVLDRQAISYRFVSRNKGDNTLSYPEVDQAIMQENHLIINTTPLGMSPNVDTFPDIPYQYAGPQHLFFDLVYNPAMTAFLKAAATRGSLVQNGLDMLYGQAEKSWQFWQK
ncbi:MAG: shikimate dehydrogenase [Saprospiraceae bacterium]|nr:shikimate dehydrogenase [Lewinella sp.]